MSLRRAANSTCRHSGGGGREYPMEALAPAASREARSAVLPGRWAEDVSAEPCQAWGWAGKCGCLQGLGYSAAPSACRHAGHTGVQSWLAVPRGLGTGTRCQVLGASSPVAPQRCVWSWRPSSDSSPSLSPRLESPPELFLDARTCQQHDRRGRRGPAGRGRSAGL